MTKSVIKISREDVDQVFSQNIDIEALGSLLNNDVSEVVDHIREQLVTKSVTKSVTKLVTKLIDFLEEEKTREQIFCFLGIGNQTKNFNTNIKPLIDNGLLELTIPLKPNSRLQKYRLTEKGKKLLKQ